jgi:hypothetical protein
MKWSVSSTEPHPITASVAEPTGGLNQEDQPMVAKAVEIVSSQRSIPLADGYFQLTLPNGWLGCTPPSEFRISWIDFYR